MPKDYILDTNGKVIVGESTKQHVRDLLALHKGWHKFSPFIGVGIDDYIDDEDVFLTLRQVIKSELQQDGAANVSVEFNSIEAFKVNANYNG